MNSISWERNRLQLLGAPQAEKASAAKRGVTPARFVTWVRLRPIGSDLRIAAVNCHFISKAFWDPPEPDVDWRRAQWLSNWTVLSQVVARLRGDGYVVLVGGDFNKTGRDVVPGLVDLMTEPLTVDRVGVPAGVTATAELGTRGGSNHRPVIAHLTIKE